MTAADASALPLPGRDGFAGAFYEACRSGELRFQRCSACGAWRHVPRALCAACGSPAFTWTPSSGRGRVFTYTIVTRAMHPGFAARVPYAPAVIELEEGVRILSEVVDCPVEELRIDLPVVVVFQEVAEGVTLPKFRRAVPAGAGREAGG
ncbi:MAG: Zn-ribbon domain-containing OB-fold protein [Deltaproteobacteria bacterium]|nr:Zn-ribbon domain-containing OB-fold protein [Deltaproteobacteria bacterium]